MRTHSLSQIVIANEDCCSAKLSYYLNDVEDEYYRSKYGQGLYAILEIMDDAINRNTKKCLGIGDRVLCKVNGFEKINNFENIYQINQHKEVKSFGTIILVFSCQQ